MVDNEDQSQRENPIRKVKDLNEEQNEHNLYAFTLLPRESEEDNAFQNIIYGIFFS